MQKNSLLFLIILIFIASSVGATYWFLQKSIQAKYDSPTFNPLKSPVFHAWTSIATGVVKGKEDNILMIENQGVTFPIFIREGALVQSISIKNGEKKAMIIALDSVRIGDEVDIGLGVTYEGKIIGSSVTVLLTQ